MLRTLPLADEQILPQAKRESYFFNRIDPKQPLGLNAFATPWLSFNGISVIPPLTFRQCDVLFLCAQRLELNTPGDARLLREAHGGGGNNW